MGYISLVNALSTWRRGPRSRAGDFSESHFQDPPASRGNSVQSPSRFSHPTPARLVPGQLRLRQFWRMIPQLAPAVLHLDIQYLCCC